MIRLYASLLALLALPALAEPAPKPTQIFLAHAQRQDAASDTVAAVADEFRKQVGALSAGRLKVEIVADGMLGGNRDTTALVEKGVIHSALVTVGGVIPSYPPLSVTQLPYAFDRLETAHQVLAGPFGQRLADGLAAHTSLQLLGFVDPPGLHIITNSRQEVRSPEQLRDLRIRAIPGSKPLAAMIASLGATPVKVSSREELSALATGAVQGQMNPPSVVLARGIDTVQRYATLSNHLYVPYVWLFNRQALAALPAADAKIVATAAQSAIAKGYQLALALQNSDQGLGGLKRRLKVHELSGSERAAFEAAMRPPTEAAIVKEIGTDGAEWMSAFKSAIAEAKRPGGRGKK